MENKIELHKCKCGSNDVHIVYHKISAACDCYQVRCNHCGNHSIESIHEKVTVSSWNDHN